MTITVKICGLTRQKDALAVAGAGADLAGLVFHSGSPRHLSLETARAIADALRGRVRMVALLIDPTDDALEEALAAAKPDFVQLHGAEPPARVAEIRARFGLPVIKAIGIGNGADFHVLPAYEAVADMLLFDARSDANPSGGGRGAAFDWQLLRNRVIRKPWLLAGGLTVQNVARAIGITGAQGVDVSSGVEPEPGIKDAESIRCFVATARAAAFARDVPA